tara:strand:- start:660 stop:1064 length:405 start_codon:yes stop_codon:yes gene_type:complete
MLVNISYSVDFDEIPKVVRSFLQGDIRRSLEIDAIHNLEDSIASLESGKENIGKSIKHVDEVRDLLLKIDMRLLDCSNILKGYQQELIAPSPNQQPPNQQPPNQQPPNLQPDLSANLSSLQEDLSKLRDQLGGG